MRGNAHSVERVIAKGIPQAGLAAAAFDHGQGLTAIKPAIGIARPLPVDRTKQQTVRHLQSL